MLSCNKCGYGFNFKKATELLDEFKKIKEPSEFVKEALQDNNKIIGEFTLPQLTKKLSSIIFKWVILYLFTIYSISEMTFSALFFL